MQVTRVSWNAVFTRHFIASNGVKQDCVLSPILFCVYIDSLLHSYNRYHRVTGRDRAAANTALCTLVANMRRAVKMLKLQIYKDLLVAHKSDRSALKSSYGRACPNNITVSSTRTEQNWSQVRELQCKQLLWNYVFRTDRAPTVLVSPQPINTRYNRYAWPMNARCTNWFDLFRSVQISSVQFMCYEQTLRRVVWTIPWHKSHLTPFDITTTMRMACHAISGYNVAMSTIYTAYSRFCVELFPHAIKNAQ